MGSLLILTNSCIKEKIDENDLLGTLAIEGISSSDSLTSGNASSKGLSTGQTITVNKLIFQPGNKIVFSGIVTNSIGVPISNVQVGIDDPIQQMCTLSPKTDKAGKFSYSSNIPTSAKGIYAFAFYYNNLKSYTTIAVNPLNGLILQNKNHQIPLGISLLTTSFDVTTSIRIISNNGFSKANQDQLKKTADQIASFMVDAGSNSLTAYVSNPVTDVVSVAAVGCAAGIWTGIGTIPCSALYSFMVVQGAKSLIVGTINTVIDKSSLSTTDKVYYKDLVKAGKCVVGIVSLDPLNAISSVSTLSTGWSCGTAISSVTSGTTKSLKIIATPTTTSRNQSVVGLVLLKKN